jgi:hypothetical protein
MRFSSAPAHGRAAVSERQRRDRAAAAPLKIRYPGLATLQVDFDFSDRSEFLPSPQVTVFHPPAQAYFRFACPYSDCSGEFDLAKTVDLMVGARQDHADGQLRCTGTRHRGTQCSLCLEFSITAHWA